MRRHFGPAVISFFMFLVVSTQILFAQERIAVLDLVGKGIEQWEASALTDQLRDEIVKSGKFRVVERQKMDRLFAEKKFQLSGCTDDQCIVRAGRILGVKHLITGSISKLGDAYHISASLVDVETGEYLISAPFDHEGTISFLLMKGMKYVASVLIGKPVPVPISDGSVSAPIETTLDQPLLPVVRDVTEEQLLLDKGSADGIRIGQPYQIFQIDSAITDPVSGDTLDLITCPSVKMFIVKVSDRVSWAKYKIVGKNTPRIGDQASPYKPGKMRHEFLSARIDLCKQYGLLKGYTGNHPLKVHNNNCVDIMLLVALNHSLSVGISLQVPGGDMEQIGLRAEYSLFRLSWLTVNAALTVGSRGELHPDWSDYKIIGADQFDTHYSLHVESAIFAGPGLLVEIPIHKNLGFFMGSEYSRAISGEINMDIREYKNGGYVNESSESIEGRIDVFRVYFGLSLNYYRTEKW